jgi:hypothetical protein
VERIMGSVLHEVPGNRPELRAPAAGRAHDGPRQNCSRKRGSFSKSSLMLGMP